LVDIGTPSLFVVIQKSSTDVDFFNPISLVCRDYLLFSLSETVEEAKKLRRTITITPERMI